jgi:CBS-domain-containing membrane protein
MYETWRETLDGMSKNSFEITNSSIGTVGLAIFFAVIALGWLALLRLHPTQGALALGLFLLSGIFVTTLARAPKWPVLLMPIGILIGGFTMLRSMVWHHRGTVTWKGRTYPGS